MRITPLGPYRTWPPRHRALDAQEQAIAEVALKIHVEDLLRSTVDVILDALEFEHLGVRVENRVASARIVITRLRAPKPRFTGSLEADVGKCYAAKRRRSRARIVRRFLVDM